MAAANFRRKYILNPSLLLLRACVFVELEIKYNGGEMDGGF